ncbi:MAG: hypothetical protein PVJ84_15625 [Desulfobacteraceae bacterium]
MLKTGPKAGDIISCAGIRLGIRWTILLLCCYIFSHCTLRMLPRDLATYINRDIYGIVELEEIALSRYQELTGDNYISDQALRASLAAEIIPVYSRFTGLVGKIRPQTKAVRKLHVIYRNAASLRLQGFRTILLAIDTQDPDLVHQANRMLDQGQHLVTLWQGRLAQLSGQYGLERQ